MTRPHQISIGIPVRTDAINQERAKKWIENFESNPELFIHSTPFTREIASWKNDVYSKKISVKVVANPLTHRHPLTNRLTGRCCWSISAQRQGQVSWLRWSIDIVKKIDLKKVSVLFITERANAHKKYANCFSKTPWRPKISSQMAPIFSLKDCGGGRVEEVTYRLVISVALWSTITKRH